jgi:hypothetical protein
MLSSVHPPLGIRIYHKECQRLAKAGYEVVLIVPSKECEFERHSYPKDL